MDAQATRLVLVPAATAARGVASALPAAFPRGLTAFEEQPVAPAGAQDSLTGPWVCVLPPGVMDDCRAGHGSLVLAQK